jgi:hypothetical protein
MQRLANDYSIVYLTHRPEYFGPKSKGWLADNDYPRAPVLLSDIAGFVAGSGEFKSTRLAEIRKDFSNIRIGIGDKISDAQAYHDNDITAYLIVMPEMYPSPAETLRLAEQIAALPEAIQVVTSWDQIGAGIYQDEKFPPSRMVSILEGMARQQQTTPQPDQAGATREGGEQ